MTTATTEELQAQLAALSAQLEQKKAIEATAAHFVDSEGKEVTNPDGIADGLLRSAGLAMEKDVKKVAGWKEKSVEEIESLLTKAVEAKDYVEAALHVAVLHAKAALAASPPPTAAPDAAEAAAAPTTTA